jgi:hypothetical protein
MIAPFHQIDLTYVSRLNRLEKIYKDGENILKECEDTWDYLLESETVSIPRLNVLQDKMESVRELMATLKQEMKKIKLELSN